MSFLFNNLIITSNIYILEIINSYQSSSFTGQKISLSVWMAEAVTARFEFEDLIVKQK